MNDIIKNIEAAQLKESVPSFNVGDTVKAVSYTHLDVYKRQFLDNGKNRLSVITGPNMAGKSTYMRQVALIEMCIRDRVWPKEFFWCWAAPMQMWRPR